jgi:hypothetical protein
MYLWRYMDYSKFMQLLTQKALYFCGARNFEDPFEGQYAWGPKGNAEFVKTQRSLHLKYGGGMDFEAFMSINMKTLNDISSQTYINCWHQSEHESEAMWKLYCKNPAEGVLIKTTENKLRNSLQALSLEKLHLNAVKYVRNNWIKQYNPEKEVFFRKRSSFEHEKEFRAIFQNNPYDGSMPKHGHLVSVDLNNLIQEIRVSPLSNKSFCELVESSALNASLTVPLMNSEIEIQPEISVEEKLLSEDEGYKQYAIRLIGKYT